MCVFCYRYSLSITATDSGGRADSATVNIEVLDANTFRPVFEQTSYSVNIFEDVPVGTTVLVVSATDGDVGENARITYTMDDIAEFQINPGSGAITTKKILDREITAGYTISVTAQDNGKPPLSDTTDVEILLADVNDNSPIFKQVSYTESIPENAIVGTSVVTISATDADAGLNGRVRYTFAGGNNGNGAFTIDPTSGIIRTDRELDREDIPQYNLIAYAWDRGNPERSASVVVTIRLEDINDSPPRFPEDPLKFYISENSPIGSTVAEVIAEDPDIGINALVEYSIVGGPDADLFQLITHPGKPTQLVTRTELDYESEKKAYQIILRASSMTLFTDTITHIIVQDVNDNRPVLKDFKIIFHNFKDHFIRNTIGRIPAHDPDVSDQLQFEVTSGNNAKLLILNQTSGALTLNSSLDTNVPIKAVMEVKVTGKLRKLIFF